MFNHRTFDVEIVRAVALESMSWPARGEAADEETLGGNRSYMDFRRMLWSAARRAFELEAELITRIENAGDSEAEYESLEDETLEAFDGLDLGVASTVFALSAARCIPFSSCNAGAFGDHHSERHPLVAFYARPAIAALLLTCAEEAQSGLTNGHGGCLVAYATDLPGLRRFAGAIITHRTAFRKLRTPRVKKPVPPGGSNQLSFP